jgi:hypothetical protein
MQKEKTCDDCDSDQECDCMTKQECDEIVEEILMDIGNYAEFLKERNLIVEKNDRLVAYVNKKKNEGIEDLSRDKVFSKMNYDIHVATLEWKKKHYQYFEANNTLREKMVLMGNSYITPGEILSKKSTE